MNIWNVPYCKENIDIIDNNLHKQASNAINM